MIPPSAAVCQWRGPVGEDGRPTRGCAVIWRASDGYAFTYRAVVSLASEPAFRLYNLIGQCLEWRPTCFADTTVPQAPPAPQVSLANFQTRTVARRRLVRSTPASLSAGRTRTANPGPIMTTSLFLRVVRSWRIE